MRAAILKAARTGRIEEMKTPYETNEMRPALGGAAVSDPVQYWRKLSADGEGREILAALLLILEGPFARVANGTKGEMFVWPAFAAMDLKQLTPPQEVALLRLVRPPEAKPMRETGRYTWWQLGIGVDGTWHYLEKR